VFDVDLVGDLSFDVVDQNRLHAQRPKRALRYSACCATVGIDHHSYTGRMGEVDFRQELHMVGNRPFASDAICTGAER
jgi:hypothetical protein